jgi:hypothetical protein
MGDNGPSWKSKAAASFRRAPTIVLSGALLVATESAAAQPNKPSPARATCYRGPHLLGQEKCVDVHAYAPSCDCHGYQDQGRIEAPAHIGTRLYELTG